MKLTTLIYLTTQVRLDQLQIGHPLGRPHCRRHLHRLRRPLRLPPLLQLPRRFLPAAVSLSHSLSTLFHSHGPCPIVDRPELTERTQRGLHGSSQHHPPLLHRRGVPALLEADVPEHGRAVGVHLAGLLGRVDDPDTGGVPGVWALVAAEKQTPLIENDAISDRIAIFRFMDLRLQ